MTSSYTLLKQTVNNNSRSLIIPVNTCCPSLLGRTKFPVNWRNLLDVNAISFSSARPQPHRLSYTRSCRNPRSPMHSTMYTMKNVPAFRPRLNFLCSECANDSPSPISAALGVDTLPIDAIFAALQKVQHLHAHSLCSSLEPQIS